MSTTPDVTVDVAIVGYGPVGQYLAYKLGSLGHTVACIERWPTTYAYPRAVHFDDETGRLFQSIGLNPDTNPVIQPYDNFYQWVNADKQVLTNLDWRGRGRSGWQNANFFYQPDLEKEIIKVIEGQPNVQVLRGWNATSIDQDDAGVTVTVNRFENAQSTDEIRTVRATYVVGADGANSMVRESQGIGITDLGFEFDWLIVDMFPHEPMNYDPPAWQWCRPTNPTTVVPAGAPHRRRWEFMRMPNETIEELNTAEAAWARVAEFGLTPENSEMERHVVYTFRARWADAWRNGRVLLAGDAAHLMPPFAGQGMCAGIRDAENLVWKFDAVLSGKADDSLLDTYGPERLQHVRHFIELSMGLGRVICIADPEAAAERDKAMMAAIADPTLAPPPPPAPRLGQGLLGSHPEAGLVSWQGNVTVDGTSGRFDDVLGYGWTVIARPGTLSGLEGPTREWAEGYGVRLLEVGPGAPVSDDDGTYTRWLDEMDVDAVIIRPDFYVYDATTADGLEAALTTLRSALVTAVMAN